MLTKKQKAVSRPFSYVDSATGFAYFNMQPSDFGDLQDRLDTALRLREENRDKFGKELLDIANIVLWTEFKSTFFHEWHHCLQTIFYPYRYLQSWRELSIAFNVISSLRNSPETFKLGSLDLLKPWRNTITSSSMVIGIDIDNGKLQTVLDRNPDEIRPTDFTTADLIEESTSIFEFKVEINSEGDGQSYHKWIRRRKLSGKTTYSNVFRLLSKLMGKEVAYFALPPMVQASFSTTWPAVTFVSLVNYTLARWKFLNPEDLDCDSLYSILRSQLIDPFFADPGKFPNPSYPTESDDYYLLDNDSFRRLVLSTKKHTVHYQALRFVDLVTRGSVMETILFHPYRSSVQDLLSNEFFPPLIHLRIHHDPLKARDSILVINPTLRDYPTPIDATLTYSDYWREIMKRKDIAYSLFTDLNNYLEHNCHHLNCPYHELNVCRRWSAIPKEWTRCSFPNWFTSVTGRKIDIETQEIPRVT